MGIRDDHDFLAPPKKKPAEETGTSHDAKAKLARLEAMLEEQARANAALLAELSEIRRLVG